MKARILTSVAALILCSAGSAYANMVSNPSFESFMGSFGGDGGAQLTSASTTLTDWHITNGEIAVLKTPNSYNLTASDGVNFLDLAGYGNAGFPKGIAQTLSGLVPGQAYALAMDLGIRNGACVSGGNNCHGPIQVSATIGGTTQTFTHDSADPGNMWGTYGFTFIAAAATEDLTILGLSLPPGNAYIGLDHVSVTAVPEPAQVWLVITGCVLIGVRRIFLLFFPLRRPRRFA